MANFFKKLKKTFIGGFSPSDKLFDLSGDKAKKAKAKEAGLLANQMQSAQTAFNTPAQVPGLNGVPYAPVTGPAAPMPRVDMRTNPTGNYGLLAQMLSRGPLQQPSPTPQIAPPPPPQQFGPGELMDPGAMETQFADQPQGLLAQDLVGMDDPRRQIPMYRPFGK